MRPTADLRLGVLSDSLCGSLVAEVRGHSQAHAEASKQAQDIFKGRV